MKYRRLGQSDLEVSEIGLGTNNFGITPGPTNYGSQMSPESAAGVMDAALDVGVNLIDTADIYSAGDSERYIGRALKGKRHRAIIATKFGGWWLGGPTGAGGSRDYIMSAVEGSLERLQTDYIDLYQIHGPDPRTPIEETLGALDELVRQGKVRYIGHSNFAAWQIVEADWTARTSGGAQFVSSQSEYSMLERDLEKEVIPVCGKYNLGILPFFPLAHGFLTGRYRRGESVPGDSRLGINAKAGERRLTASNFDVIERLSAWVEERGITLVELAFAWLLACPEVSSVIAGASRPEQIFQNASTVQCLLTPEDMAELNTILSGDSS